MRSASSFADADHLTVSIVLQFGEAVSQLRNRDQQTSRNVSQLADVLVGIPHIEHDIGRGFRIQHRSGFLDVPGRTAKRLLELAGNQEEFQLPVTQEELAGLVGASRERVNKAISAFIRLGWLEQADRRYRITDRVQLSRRAT